MPKVVEHERGDIRFTTILPGLLILIPGSVELKVGFENEIAW